MNDKSLIKPFLVAFSFYLRFFLPSDPSAGGSLSLKSLSDLVTGCLNVSLSCYVCVYLFVSLSVLIELVSTLSLSVFLPLSLIPPLSPLSFRLTVGLSVFLFVCLYFRLSVRLLVFCFLSICLSVSSLTVYLSVIENSLRLSLCT